MHLTLITLTLLISKSLAGVVQMTDEEFSNFEQENTFCDADICKGCGDISYIRWYEGCGEYCFDLHLNLNLLIFS